MKLFKCNEYMLLTSYEMGKIETPLGMLAFDICINNYAVSSVKPKNIYQLIDGGKVYVWNNVLFNAELLICRPQLNIPQEMKIDDCWVGIWRLEVCQDNSLCIYSCVLEKNKRVNWSPNSGEHLDAQTWDDGNTYITVGTEDGERLATRAIKGEIMPSRLTQQINNLGLVQYSEKGLSVPIPHLVKGDICQIHFTASWGKSEVDTWYAAGILSGDILKGLRCI